MVGSTLAGPIAKRFGRKNPTYAALIPHVIAWGLIAVAQNYYMLVAGMVINGFSMGAMDTLTRTYMAEASHPKYRGQLLGSAFVCAVAATLLVYLLSLVLNWRGLAVYIAMMPVLLVPNHIGIPESPAWLLSKGRTEEALESMQWLYGDKYDLVHDFKESVKHQEETRAAVASWRDAMTPRYLKPVLLVSMVILLRQLTGSNIMMMYLSQILRRANLGLDAKHATIIIATAQLGVVLIAGRLLDMLGRKKSILISGTLMAVSEVAMGVYLYMDEHEETRHLITG
jgi:SP family facilitated glucose transporter-like MFS transporter 8